MRLVRGEFMRIITDTASLYTPEEGQKQGVTVLPAYVLIDNRSYADYRDISSEEFLDILNSGEIATSSQPSIGDVIDLYEGIDEEIVHLSLGDGLSGAYQNAMGAKNSMDENDHIHIVDTKTLAAAQRYLVRKALTLKEEGLLMEQIKKELEQCAETSYSYVIPEDFEFLKRSGRLTPIAAKIVTVIKIVPVLTLTEDRKKITLFTVKRSKRKALDAIIENLKEKGVNKDHLIMVSHAENAKEAESTCAKLKEHFAESDMEIHKLAPSLMTHGGPGCIVVQVIRK